MAHLILVLSFSYQAPLTGLETKRQSRPGTKQTFIRTTQDDTLYRVQYLKQKVLHEAKTQDFRLLVSYSFLVLETEI